MRIAIVHYHLRPGGVTHVIRETSAALTALGVEHVVLADDVPGLCYGESSGPEELTARLRAAAHAALGCAPDAWVFHNPTLGKNRDIPGVIERLAAGGEAILQHIHDLAEDGRSANFSNIPDASRLHLTAPRLHHAFINRRDHERFLAAGLPGERAHLLPNPVSVDLGSAGAIADFPLIFYPVRGIRRKNLGELCLLAALTPQDARFAVGLAPENPDEIPTHDFWRDFAAAHDLPVWFDVTDRLAPLPHLPSDFLTWRRTSTHWITTSIAEGFGQTTAEAAACGKPLIARRLETGFLPTDGRGIYQKIEVAGAGVDFSELDEPAQAAVILRVLGGEDAVTMDGEPARTWLNRALAQRSPRDADSQLAAHAPGNVATALIEILETLARQPHRPPEFLPQQKLAALYRDSPALLSSPRPPARHEFLRAVIFDVYGTLLAAPPGGVRPDPTADPAIIIFLENNRFDPPASPTGALAERVARAHAASDEAFPEIDLVALWAGLLGIPVDAHAAMLVAEIEDLWHPATPMPGAAAMLRRLAAMGVPCGLLSNAQANIWRQLGPLAPCFASDLCIFSHQFLRAKPSPAMFAEMVARLARRGIAPHEVWFVGNDPANDIVPAKAAGFRAALFGNADHTAADLHLTSWDDFPPG